MLTHTHSWDIVPVKTGTGSPLLISKSSSSHKALNLHPLNTYLDQALNLEGQSNGKSSVPSSLWNLPPQTHPYLLTTTDFQDSLGSKSTFLY